MDLLWFRLPHRSGDPDRSFARLSRGQMLAMIFRGDYWQTAYVVPKDSVDEWLRSDIDLLRTRLESLVPWFDGRTAELAGWQDVHRLDVRIDRARRWYRPGLLAIGDAAHAMSVVGGVGVNLAIQDAVAAANLLVRPLRRGTLATRHLAAVQRRRLIATMLTQRLQRTIQNRFLTPLLSGKTAGRPPKILRAMFRLGPLQRAKARLIAVGFRPERANKLPAQRPASAAGARPSA